MRKLKNENIIFKVRRIKKRKFRRPLFQRRKKDRGNKYAKVAKKKKSIKTFIFFLLFLASILVVVFGVYFLIKYVIDLRNTEEENIRTGMVYGFENIPEYPYSEFVFKDELDNEYVKSFLSLGSSVYRITDKSSISDVFEYYKQRLVDFGWEHVNSVPLTSEEMLYGEYWTREGKGLRIYSRISDIWYETITVAQAQNGLEDIVKRDTARKLLLMTSDKAELLPDYSWRLSFPSEYIATYYATEISTLQGVQIKKLGSNGFVLIEPVGYYKAISFDAFITKFLKQYNKKNKTKWNVIDSKEVEMNSEVAVQGFITDGSNEGEIWVTNNTSNSVVYVFVSFEKDDPFLDYLVEKIRPSAPIPSQ